jgi:hypothetical protein
MKLKIVFVLLICFLLTGCSFMSQLTKVNNEVTEEEWKVALNYELYENSTMNVAIDEIDYISTIEIKFLESKMFYSITEKTKDNPDITEDEGLIDLTDYRIYRIYSSAEKNVADSQYMSRSTMFNSPEDVTYEYMLKVVGFSFLNNLLLNDYYNIAVYENGKYIIDGDLIGNGVINNQEMYYNDMLIKYTFKDKKLISIEANDKKEESFRISVNFSNIGTTTLNYDTSAICTHQFSLEHDMIKNSEVHEGVCLLCSELDKHGNYINVYAAHLFENGICEICGWELKK